MEIGLREWLIIGGILVIALILFDGWRRIRGGRNRIRLDIDRSALGDDGADDDLHYANPELPNGGARRRSGDDIGERREPSFGPDPAAPAEATKSNVTAPKTAAVSPQPSPADLAAEQTATSQPRMAETDARVEDDRSGRDTLRDMDPLFDDVPVEPRPRSRRAASAAKAAPSKEEDPLDSAISQGEFDGLSLDGFSDAEMLDKQSSPTAPLRASRDDEEPVSMSLDFDPEQPIPVLKDRLEPAPDPRPHAPEPHSDASTELEVDADEGLSLSLDEPVAETRSDNPRSNAAAPEPTQRPLSGDGAQAPAAPSAEREPPRKRPAPEISADPEEMLVIFVVGKDKQMLPGGAIRTIVEACGMEFGEMGIYHRHEHPNAEGSLQFSMANAIQPGTFDLETMDALETPAVTFFMSMRDPADPLYAYECMLATAETLSRHLDAELLDGDRSVMRPQTKEHYRERIRDFEIHKRVKRAH